MLIQKMSWAGIHIDSGETKIAIDPLYHFPIKFGTPHEELVAWDQFGSVDAVLITHLHEDHFDVEGIKRFYGEDVPVYVAQELQEEANKRDLTNVKGVVFGDSFSIGELTITSTFAVDGIGDHQIAYVIEGDGKRIFHTGDTLWHGYWRKIKERFGIFDTVFLPVNGAVINNPALSANNQQIVMTPEQAVSAAVILQAGNLVPIHYGVVHHPPLYRQTEDVLGRLKESAGEKVKVKILQVKESITL
ncbi:MBL fold metallo-hydrolase [Shimazuella kribbensis]|uniref:MBL fold metallo-hydrolase n=1 Tax=Shimazuella kribbensis TaxID=139808 RepID=UPI0003FF946E|nr:MBL fold metallo-hydrolase [Shimazuella kribbensis]